METTTEKRVQLYLEAEKLVYDVLSSGSVKPDDTDKIARICNLSDFQVGVAIQLLSYKNMLPVEALVH
jgi:hypothetical protein